MRARGRGGKVYNGAMHEQVVTAIPLWRPALSANLVTARAGAQVRDAHASWAGQVAVTQKGTVSPKSMPGRKFILMHSKRF